MPVSLTAKQYTYTNGNANNASQIESELNAFNNNFTACKTEIDALMLGNVKEGLTLTLRQSFAGTPASSDHISILANRGVSVDVGIRWNETSDKWQLTEDGTNYYNIYTTNSGNIVSVAGGYTPSANGDIGYDSTAHVFKVQVNSAAQSLVHTGNAAAQADQETATSTTTFVQPGVQHYHPSSCKAWVKFNGTGTVTINGSYNVASITDNGTGDYTINFSTPFSSANYCAVRGLISGSVGGEYTLVSQTAGAFRFETRNASDALNDQANIMLAFYGDL